MATAHPVPARSPRAGVVLADLVPGARVRDAALVLAGAGLTGVAAQISVQVPSITPVPFTLQTLAVLLVGASFGPTRGLVSIGLYLVAGGLGVPWFAGHGSGFGGPSFGYVIGFAAAAVVVGALARRGNDRSVMSSIGVMAVGELILFAVGTGWLAADLHLSASRAIALGVTPFLIGELIKLAVAALALPAVWKLVRR